MKAKYVSARVTEKGTTNANPAEVSSYHTIVIFSALVFAIEILYFLFWYKNVEPFALAWQIPSLTLFIAGCYAAGIWFLSRTK